MRMLKESTRGKEGKQRKLKTFEIKNSAWLVTVIFASLQ